MYQGLREKGTQSHMVDQMQTRAALYEFLGYHEYEAKLDELFLDEKAKESWRDVSAASRSRRVQL